MAHPPSPPGSGSPHPFIPDTTATTTSTAGNPPDQQPTLGAASGVTDGLAISARSHASSVAAAYQSALAAPQQPSPGGQIHGTPLRRGFTSKLPDPVYRLEWPRALRSAHGALGRRFDAILPVLAQCDAHTRRAMMALAEPLRDHCHDQYPDLMTFLAARDRRADTTIFQLAALCAHGAEDGTSPLASVLTALRVCPDPDTQMAIVHAAAQLWRHCKSQTNPPQFMSSMVPILQGLAGCPAGTHAAIGQMTLALAKRTDSLTDVVAIVTGLSACKSDADRQHVAQCAQAIARFCGNGLRVGHVIDALNACRTGAERDEITQMALELCARAPHTLDTVVSALLYCATSEMRHSVLRAAKAFAKSFPSVRDFSEVMRAFADCRDTLREDIAVRIKPFAKVYPDGRGMADIIRLLDDCPREGLAEVIACAEECFVHFPGAAPGLDALVGSLVACQNRTERQALLAMVHQFFAGPTPGHDIGKLLEVFHGCPDGLRHGAFLHAPRFFHPAVEINVLCYILRSLAWCTDPETQGEIALFGQTLLEQFGPQIVRRVGPIMMALNACDKATHASVMRLFGTFIAACPGSIESDLSKIIVALGACATDQQREFIVAHVVPYFEHCSEINACDKIFAAMAYYPLLGDDVTRMVVFMHSDKSVDEVCTHIQALHMHRALCTVGMEEREAQGIAFDLMPKIFLKQQLSHAERRRLHALMTSDPAVAHVLSQYLTTTEMKYWDGGVNYNTYARFFAALVPEIAPPQDDAVRACMRAVPPVDQPPVDVALPGRLVDVCGRTLLYEIPGDPEHYVAIKLAKDGENVADTTSGLRREVWMDHVLLAMKDQLGLQSAIPQPMAHSVVQVALTAEIRARVDQQATRFDAREFDIAVDEATGKAIAIQTIVPRGYHRYLNDPTLSAAEFRAASQRCMHDCARLTRAGLHNVAPADLFHNEEKMRRYVWNSEEVPAAAAGRHMEGAGRLHGAFRSVRTPNLRESGWADAKHDYAQSTLLRDHPNKEFFQQVGENGPQIAAISCAGDSLLSWALVVADSWAHRTMLGAAVEQLDLAEELRFGFVEFYAQYTGIPADRAAQVLESIIDFPRMARQFQYFTTGEYIREAQAPGGISRARWRELYGPFTSVMWGMEKGMRGWTRAGGWRYDSKHIDLGPVNGPFPCQELTKALYATTHLAMMQTE